VSAASWFSLANYLYFYRKLVNWIESRRFAYFLLQQITVMRTFMQIVIFFSWLAALIWAGLELEKIQFFQSVYALLQPG